jgi:anti-sigma regulatory factor (Ser/Thr protein kinase)
MAETKRSKLITDFIISNVEMHGKDIASLAAKEFGITRQGINKHIRQLVHDGVLAESGSTRAKQFALAARSLVIKSYERSSGLAEDKVYLNDVKPYLQEIQTTTELTERIYYCFTEILNNAIDHSEAKTIGVLVEYDIRKISILIRDDGIGIFKKIKDSFQLEDEREAILELSKGKLTTAPDHHSGQGIFFSSRISDGFFISSHSLRFFSELEDDLQIEKNEYSEGTSVLMHFDRNSSRTSKEVFDKYVSPGDDDYGFTVTHVPVILAMTVEENLVSRSQAKRLLARLDKFQEVVLDFAGVKQIGQAFADEIFRVYRNIHPQVHIIYTNANEDVTRMIHRALSAKQESEGQ